jgi:hypothetical protein
MIEPIIEDTDFYSHNVSDAIQLIQHHHRPHIVRGDSRPLVFIFVDESRLLAELYAMRWHSRAEQSDLLPKSLKIPEHYFRFCWPLEETFRAIGSGLSWIPEFHSLITSVENSTLISLGAFRFMFPCAARSFIYPD